jgi:hypothetical protein
MVDVFALCAQFLDEIYATTRLFSYTLIHSPITLVLLIPNRILDQAVHPPHTCAAFQGPINASALVIASCNQAWNWHHYKFSTLKPTTFHKAAPIQFPPHPFPTSIHSKRKISLQHSILDPQMCVYSES